MLDDGQVGFTHFGSPGWMLQRPESEKAAVHGIFPDIAPLAQWLGGDPYGPRSRAGAHHIDSLVTVTGHRAQEMRHRRSRRHVWPGVLAETGSPFAWTPEISGAFSFIGLYFGLHEALLCLKKRGIVLACVSKNDEATVRELWKYQSIYPRQRLLTPGRFRDLAHQLDDKVDNIRSIADELGFALDTFLFIDDIRSSATASGSDFRRWRSGARTRSACGGGFSTILACSCRSSPRKRRRTIAGQSTARAAALRPRPPTKARYLDSLQINCRIERLTAAPPTGKD